MRVRTASSVSSARRLNASEPQTSQIVGIFGSL
jgi:hypothetical protein